MSIKKLIEKRDKYEDLVSYVRKNPEMRKNIPALNEFMSRVELYYPNDLKELENDEDNWQHGFNSGCLAAFRYALECLSGDIEAADEEFPNLDT